MTHEELNRNIAKHCHNYEFWKLWIKIACICHESNSLLVVVCKCIHNLPFLFKFYHMCLLMVKFSLDVGHLSFISLLITASPPPPFKSLFSYLLEELCVFSLCLSTQIRCESFSIKTFIEVEACEIFEINFIRAFRSNLIDY